MSEHKFYLKPLPAAVVFQKFVDVLQEIPTVTSISDFHISTNLFSKSFARNLTTNTLGQDKEVGAVLASLQKREFLELNSLTANITPNRAISYYSSEKSPAYFQIRVDDSAPDFASQVADILHKHFNLCRHGELIASSLPENEQRIFQYAQVTISDFATQAAKLAQSAATQTEEFTRLLREKMTDLDERYQTKADDLESRYKAKEKELEQREQKHAELVKEFDARSNTLVRRNLLAQYQKQIDDQRSWQASQATVAKRKIIHWICLPTLFLSAGWVACIVSKLMNTPQFDWHNLLSFTPGTLLFISTAVFYIKWNDHWFQEHAQAEFTNRKFAADMLRASWLAELVMEWESKKQTEFSPELINRLSMSLFEAPKMRYQSKHPFDQLHELFKTISRVKVSKDGVEVAKEKDGAK
ncbi:MAG: hypothetical protein HZC54_22515 [Verrucomicrobia bacterium]|nr:hypothetical protein [Verrucomicrobiota bacterium]